MTSESRRRIDVDQLLIFALLAVTIAQMGWYLASYAPPWMGWLGYLQAVAVDAAIWRSAWWYKRDRSAKRRRVSLFGVLAFSLVSAWYNYGYYTMRAPELPAWHRMLMAIALPAGVALLSYLAAQHEQPAKTDAPPESAKPEPAKRLTFEEFTATHPALDVLTTADIAAIAGISERQARNWRKKNNNGGGNA